MGASDKTKLDGVAPGANLFQVECGNDTFGDAEDGLLVFSASGGVGASLNPATGQLSVNGSAATTSSMGMMSAADKTKLDGVATGANKTVVDSALSSSSSNPVQNKAVNAALAAKAPLASPALTGTPKAPTAAAGDSSTQIATTAFVAAAVAAAQTGAAVYKGSVTPTSYAALASYKPGWYWVVTEAGAVAGEACEAGDMVFCNAASAAGATAPSDAHFDVVQANVQAMTAAEVEAICV